MQWSLFVLILMGQCSFFTCHLYEYHFIREEKSWDEAQRYCREKYTDLATVSDMRDVGRLTNPPQTTDAWIGLRSINERDIKEWHWSLPGEKYYPTECDPGCEPEWGPNQPSNGGVNPENCVVITRSKWNDAHCSQSFKFICYNETGHWDPDSFKDAASKTCAMTTPNGKWSSDNCMDKKPFYCYEDKVILIKERKTWDEALASCREKQRDLVSITDSHQQRDGRH
ncbi:hypothetical protein JOQ06_013823 [Pogonophryne albipinna]|uniref:C-type lectin domain-containing protein n=1 Tax=Pogonophryne albipinna TaxID=1090488 RepID=A0AAD6BJM8_9TELE|nr:hypothetical protein JOQ06_013823 [Pogonophryne albipinna]